METFWNIVSSFAMSFISWGWYLLTNAAWLLMTPAGWLTIVAALFLIAWLKRRLPDKARDVMENYTTAGLWRMLRRQRWSWGHWLLSDYDWSKDTRGIAVKTITDHVEVPVHIRRSVGEWLTSTIQWMLVGAAILFVGERWNWFGPYFWKLFGY